MLTFIYGKQSVLDALKHRTPVRRIYLKTGTHIPHLIPKDVEVLYVSTDELDRLANNGNHQGMVAEIFSYKTLSFSELLLKKPPRILVLDHIQDVQNLGAIIRSANSFSYNYILIPKERSAAVTPAVAKVASGGLAGVEVITVSSLLNAVLELKRSGIWVYATALNERSKPIKKVTFNSPLAIILGNENTGVSKTLQNAADELFFVPTSGTVQSLNVAAAAAIVMYETMLPLEKK